MSGDLTWIWARWSYLAQESSWCRVGFTAYLVVCGLLVCYLPTYLPIYIYNFYFPSSSREKISQRESNRQPLHLEMGTSPLSLGSLGSFRTFSCQCCYKVDACYTHTLLSTLTFHRIWKQAIISVRWFANPNHARSHLLHNSWSAYECVIQY